VGNRVVIGTNASVLGAIVLGDDCRVGANSVVVRDVPPGATVVGVPGRIVQQEGKSVAQVGLVDMPDPQGAIIQQLAERIYALEQRLAEVGLPTQPSRGPAINAAIFDDVSPSI
jgi:serine O-acetyltransferase